MSDETTAAIVVIGNEILSGKVADSNSPFLAKELRAAGVSLRRVHVIPDEVDEIGQCVRECSDAYDFVFTSGGVGPTHDDVTIEGVARGFGVDAVVDPELQEMIEKHAGEALNEHMLRMALVPEGAELVTTPEVVWPTVVFGNVYILPGIPEIFEVKIKALRERFRTEPYHLRQVLVSENETTIAPYLDATLEAFPELLLGSYPKWANPEYSVRLTLESKDEAYVERALADLVGRMPEGYVIRIES